MNTKFLFYEKLFLLVIHKYFPLFKIFNDIYYNTNPGFANM